MNTTTVSFKPAELRGALRPRSTAGDSIRILCWTTAVAISFLILLPTVARAFSFYSVTDLGTLGTGASGASAINNRGEVVGNVGSGNVYSYLPFIGDRAYLYSNGVTSALNFNGVGHTWAWDINDAGQVAGSAETIKGNAAYATIYQAGAVTSLGTLGGDFSWGYKNNQSGVVVGLAEPAFGRTRAFVWDGASFNLLGTLGGDNSEAHSINDYGNVVGWSDTGQQ